MTARRVQISKNQPANYSGSFPCESRARELAELKDVELEKFNCGLGENSSSRVIA